MRTKVTISTIDGSKPMLLKDAILVKSTGRSSSNFGLPSNFVLG